MIVEEKRWSKDRVICHLKVEDGEYWLTNKRDEHTTLPVQEFPTAYYISIENNSYKWVGETALSMWLKHNENDRNRIIDIVENLILGNVVRIDS